MSDRSYVSLRFRDTPASREWAERQDNTEYETPFDTGDGWLSIAWDEVAWGFTADYERNEPYRAAMQLVELGVEWDAVDGGYPGMWPETQYHWCPECPNGYKTRTLDGDGGPVVTAHEWRALTTETPLRGCLTLVSRVNGHFSDDHHRWL